MRSIILISEDKVKTVSNLDNNVFGKWLLPAIREAQDVQLQSIIGSTLYNQLLTLVDSGDIALEEYELYKDLLDNQIADFLVYQSLVNVIPLINVNMANMGTVVSNDEHIQTLSQGNVDLVRGYYQNLADIYQKRLQDFLKCHREYFPELNECGCDNCGVKPNLNSNTNTSGIWLGGLRNPKKVRGTSGCCGGASQGDGEYKDGFDNGVAFQKNKLASTAFTVNGEYQREDGWNRVFVNIDTQSFYDKGYDDGYTSGETHQKSLLVSTAFTENGDYSREDGWDNINVNVPDRYDDGYDDGYTDGYESGETHQKSLLIATAVTANGTYGRSNGYSSIEVNVPTGSTINNQTKNIIVRQNGDQIIGYDSGYTGLEQVNLKVEVPEKSLEEVSAWYGENGVYEILPEVGADGMSKVTVEIDVPQEGYTQEDLDNAYASGKTDQKNLLVSTAFTENGTYNRENGYSAVTVNVPDRYDDGFQDGYTDGYEIGRDAGIEYQKALILPLTVTENGTYSGENGFSPVIVNVPSGCSQEALDEAYNRGYQDGYNNRSRLTVNPTIIETVDNSGRTYNIVVSSNTEWTVDTYPDWCTLSQYSGTGDATIVMTLPTNTGDTRTGAITYSTTDNVASASTAVIQQGISSELSVIPSNNSLTYSSQTLTLTLTSNTDWVLDSYPNWIVPSITSGSGNATITLAISENEGDLRETILTFRTLFDEKQSTVYIQQENSSQHSYVDDYLTFEVVSGSTPIKWISANNRIIEYSTDLINWNSITGTTGGTSVPVTLNVGTKVYFRKNNSAYVYDGSRFDVNGNLKVKVYGNIMSMLYYHFNDKVTLSKANVFKGLFSDCQGIVDASNLVLPATTLTNSCYQRMFENCSGLTKAPSILPATTISKDCYRLMFSQCYALTTAPVLPATTLAPSCYAYMFVCCIHLTTPPVLPATTLANGCYYCMFEGCTKITRIELPAEHKVSNCYYRMFYGCTNLRYIKCMLRPDTTETLTGGTEWVYGVKKDGTFVKFSQYTNWESGKNGIPADWTVQNNI